MQPSPTIEVFEQAAEKDADELTRMGAAYAHALLYIGDLHALIRQLCHGAVDHKHGNTPRVLVFADAFDSLAREAKRPEFAKPVDDAAKLGTEITNLRQLGQRSASYKATLTLVRDYLQALPAGASTTDILQTVNNELGKPATHPAELSEQVLTDFYFPVDGDPREGDVIFDTERRKGRPADGQKPFTGEVLLRPVGRQAGLLLRLRAVASQLQSLATVEEKLAKRHPKRAHLGRAQGFNVAFEMLTGPSWTLPAAQWKTNG